MMKLSVLSLLALVSVQEVAADSSKPKPPGIRGSPEQNDADDAQSKTLFGGGPFQAKPPRPPMWDDDSGDDEDEDDGVVTGTADININIVGGTNVGNPSDFPYYVYWGT